MLNVTHREISPEEFVKELINGYRLPCFGFKNVSGQVIQILKVDHPIKEGTTLGLRAWVADGLGDAYVEVVKTESDVFSGIFRGCLLQEKDIYVYGDIQGSFVVFEEEVDELRICGYTPNFHRTSIEELKSSLIGKVVKAPHHGGWVKITGIARDKSVIGEALKSGELVICGVMSQHTLFDGKFSREITANPAWVGGGI